MIVPRGRLKGAEMGVHHGARIDIILLANFQIVKVYCFHKTMFCGVELFAAHGSATSRDL